MKVAFMSDSHDNVWALAEALRLAARRGVEHVVHLGDIVAPFNAQVFKDNFAGEVDIVFGNNDGDRVLLVERFSEIGARLHHPPVTLRVGPLTIAAMHEPLFPESIAETGMFDLVAWGHTHRLEINRQGRVLMLNPGELHGFLSGRKTFIILDTETMEPEVVEL